MSILFQDRKNLKQRVMNKGLKTRGRVVDWIRKPDPALSDWGMVKIEYRNANGFLFEHIVEASQGLIRLQPGDEVDIWYYHYKSIVEATLETEEVNPRYQILMKWGIVIAVLGLILSWSRWLNLF